MKKSQKILQHCRFQVGRGDIARFYMHSHCHFTIYNDWFELLLLVFTFFFILISHTVESQWNKWLLLWGVADNSLITNTCNYYQQPSDSIFVRQCCCHYFHSLILFFYNLDIVYLCIFMTFGWTHIFRYF